MSAVDPGDLRELRVVEAELNERWPETKIEPSLDRIRALTDLLAEPQRSYPVVHIAGTNGKSSTSRMADALLTRLGLRTGRYTSPHLQLATERISVDGAPISPEGYVEAFRDVAPYVSLVDSRSDVPMSKFEVLTGMAFAAFADAPVEVLDRGWFVPETQTALPLPEDAQAALDRALEAFVGSNIEPMVLLGTQVVAGTNFAILCRVTPVVPNAVPIVQVVTVYADLQGNAKFISFCAIDPAAFNQ